MKPRWPHLLFGSVWFITACIFVALAIDAYKLGKISLPRTKIRMPMEAQIVIQGPSGGASYNQVINQVADVADESSTRIEISIRHSAHTLFVLNIVSVFASGLGFAAQIGEFFHERRKHGESDKAKTTNQSP